MSKKELQNALDHTSEVSQAVVKHKPRAIIYCRVSTNKQEEDGESLEYQEEKCRQYAELHDYIVLAVLKEAKSGYIHYSHREQLSLARQFVRDGLADVLIVFDLRRFSRNFVHSSMIFEEIEQAGGMIISVSENIDNSLTGKLIRSILAWSAESERHKIVEYANRHWQSRLENNLPVATGRAPYGWQWKDEAKTTYKIDLEEGIVRYSIFTMFVELEMSLRAIAHKLTEDGILPPGSARGRTVKHQGWHPSTIHYILKDEANIGILRICWSKKALTEKGTETRRPNEKMKRIPGGIPAIVSEELFERAQRKLQTNQEQKSHQPRDPENFLLTGHIYCQTCQYKMAPRNRRSRGDHRYPFYTCCNHHNKYMACPDLPTVAAKNIDELVWEDCCRVFERLEQIEAVVEKNIEETIASMLEDTEGKKLVASLQQEIQYAEIEQKKHPEGSYYYSLIAEDISKKKEQLKLYEQENLESKLVVNQVDLYKKRVYRFLDFLNTMRGNYKDATFQKKRDAIHILGVKVFIFPEEKEKDLSSVEQSPKEWLTLNEASQVTGIAMRTLQFYLCSGELQVQAERLGAEKKIVHRENVVRFLQEKPSHNKKGIALKDLEQEWFTVEELAAVLKCSPQNIQAHIKVGNFAATMTGTPHALVHREVLSDFLKTTGIKPKNTVETLAKRVKVTYSPIFREVTSVQSSLG